MAAPKKAKNTYAPQIGPERAALLLNALGPVATSKILAHLRDNDIRRIVSLMGKTKKASVETIKEVMMEFYKALSEEDEIIFGEDYNKDSLVASLGEDRAKLIFGAATGAAAQQRTLEALEMVDTRTLANYLRNEHPQTIALIVAHLPIEKRTDVLKRLQEEVQGEVVLRMANLDYISPDLLEQVDDVLKTGLATMGTMETTQIGGVEPVAGNVFAAALNVQDPVEAVFA